MSVKADKGLTLTLQQFWNLESLGKGVMNRAPCRNSMKPTFSRMDTMKSAYLGRKPSVIFLTTIQAQPEVIACIAVSSQETSDCAPRLRCHNQGSTQQRNCGRSRRHGSTSSWCDPLYSSSCCHPTGQENNEVMHSL